MDKNYKEILNRIDTFIFDVDGVFTNGIVLLTDSGEQLRTANVRDGYVVQLAAKMGYKIAIITGGRQEAVRKRFNGLGVQDVFLGSSDKMMVFNKYVQENHIDLNRVLYMGDDIPDHQVMQQVALPTCPSDAAPEIKAISKYISPNKGGEGCVRDVIEQTLRAQGKWMKEGAEYW